MQFDIIGDIIYFDGEPVGTLTLNEGTKRDYVTLTLKQLEVGVKYSLPNCKELHIRNKIIAVH